MLLMLCSRMCVYACVNYTHIGADLVHLFLGVEHGLLLAVFCLARTYLVPGCHARVVVSKEREEVAPCLAKMTPSN